MRKTGNREQGIGNSGEGKSPAEPRIGNIGEGEAPAEPVRGNSGEGKAPAEPLNQPSILSAVEGCGRFKTGLFVTLEGIEGSGKTTLASLLAEKYSAKGREVIVTAEPGGCKVGEEIRRLVLHSIEPISDKAELLLFEAARAQHVDKVIRPALERGAVVICDRFADSSLAYQGYARGIDIDEVKALNAYATSGLAPTITFLLDLPAEAGLARQKKIDRISSEDLAFHEAVRNGFLAIAEAEPERFVIIDAAQDIELVFDAAIIALERVAK